MTPEREELIRSMWSRVRSHDFRGDTLVVPIPPKPFRARTHTEHLTPELIERLQYRRGVEFNDEAGLKRYFVECEGVRVAEDIVPISRKD